MILHSFLITQTIPCIILNRCEDDKDFRFDYEDVETGNTVKKCSKLSKEDEEVIDRACEEQYMYPDDSGELTTLKNICISTCGNCP